MELLQKKGISAAALYSVPDLMEDEHLRVRGFWDRINDPRPNFGDLSSAKEEVLLCLRPL